MGHMQAIQTALDYIDETIKARVSAPRIARRVGYSEYYFQRLFKDTAGIPLMAYVTWRKLQYALFDLSAGKKIIDVALDYGFETHAGFTKAFRRAYGFPPVRCTLRIKTSPPSRMSVGMLINKFYGGDAMNPHIIGLTPFAAVGYPSRHQRANIKTTADAPTFWNTLNLDYSTLLTKLYDVFPKSKHMEISMCYDVNEETGEFSYLLGRGIDNPEDLKNIEPDMTRVDIGGGLYAIFSTKPADSYIEAAQETWNEIFLKWLPQSEFEFDETRHDFEYHDRRDHGQYFGGKLQIDICIPIKQREEEIRKARLRM
ncbi:MAG TPA: helix-turn-helix domain-containing protein, partial [Clostridia bacterium]|nr:helix-turn-helix domain-containing protein [Clostridia bacterium]